MPGIFFPSSKPIFIDIQATIQKLKELALEIARRFSDIQAIYIFLVLTHRERQLLEVMLMFWLYSRAREM